METLLSGSGLEILTLSDFPDADLNVEETGCTYAENAEIKALSALSSTGLVCISDDAGLEIDALDGQPGVYSKRFLGEKTSFPEKMKRIIELLNETPDEERGCRFRCAVVIAAPDGTVIHCEGVCEGRIAREIKGEYGFGYDPIFLLPEIGLHMAELEPEQKHLISHRGRALTVAREELKRLFALND